MTSPEPDWSLLPHDPEAFFRLEPGYDRRDLKRAYNQFLKQFKPEKHPEEFQRLRTAYETLEQRLRYDTRLAPPSVPLSTGGWDLQTIAPQPVERQQQPAPKQPPRDPRVPPDSKTPPKPPERQSGRVPPPPFANPPDATEPPETFAPQPPDRQQSVPTRPFASSPDPRPPEAVPPQTPDRQQAVPPRPFTQPPESTVPGREVPPQPPSRQESPEPAVPFDSSVEIVVPPQSAPAVPPTEPAVPWHVRVQSESVETLAAELREQAHKSAYDYYCLALMADALPDAEPLAITRWLLAGLKEHPQDPALFAMLAQALRNPLGAKQIAAVLPAVAKVVRDDRFYFLTEPLWDQLLARGDFADFARLLQACESQLRDHRIAGKLTFYLHILRPALWRADDRWIEQAVELLDNHANELGRQCELELEIFGQLRAYRGIRDEFLDGDPVRAALDNVIQDYCLLKDFEAEQSFLRFQVLLGSGDLDVLSAFPPEADAVCMAAYQAWNWIEMDMAMRFGVDFNQSDADEDSRQLRKSVRTLLRGLEARGRAMLSGQAAAWIGTAYQTTNWFCYPVLFCLLMAGPWLFAPKMQGEVWVLLTIGAVVATYFLGKLVSAKLLLPFWQASYRSRLRACYHKLWRVELLQFIRDRYLSYDALRATLVDMQGDGLHCTNALLAFAMGDVSLAMSASALRFLS